VAQGGATGVEMFEKHAAIIDVVLLDLTMPRMGGEDVFRVLRGHHPETPIVLMSGYDASEAVGRLGGDKPAGFVHKPFHLEELLEQVRAAVRLSQRGSPDAE
jgi:DNA-binding response OmpR family regulator